jgi:hypothetical protein
VTTVRTAGGAVVDNAGVNDDGAVDDDGRADAAGFEASNATVAAVTERGATTDSGAADGVDHVRAVANADADADTLADATAGAVTEIGATASSGAEVGVDNARAVPETDADADTLAAADATAAAVTDIGATTSSGAVGDVDAVGRVPDTDAAADATLAAADATAAAVTDIGALGVTATGDEGRSPHTDGAAAAPVQSGAAMLDAAAVSPVRGDSGVRGTSVGGEEARATRAWAAGMAHCDGVVGPERMPSLDSVRNGGRRNGDDVGVSAAGDELTAWTLVHTYAHTRTQGRTSSSCMTTQQRTMPRRELLPYRTSTHNTVTLSVVDRSRASVTRRCATVRASGSTPPWRTIAGMSSVLTTSQSPEPTQDATQLISRSKR